MISFKKKERMEFRKAVYKESMEPVKNPGRGWYRIYTFVAGQSLEEPFFSNTQREEESLSLMLFDIGAYFDRELPNEVLCTFKSILKRFEAAGMDVILRVVYDREGKGLEKEPARISIVQSHMKVLGRTVKEAGNAVFLSQGLFVGSWGEMHGSKFLSKEQIKNLFLTWDEATGETVWTAFRRPQQIRLVFPEIPEDCRVGFFDDAMFGSPDHLGTFGSVGSSMAQWEEAWEMERELAFLERITRAVPCGGEAVLERGPALGEGAEQTVGLLQRMHVSYLNCAHDKRILEGWQHTAYGGWKSLYEYIGAHLGYRFVVQNVCLNEKRMLLCVSVVNTGFAGICDEVGAELIAEAKQQKEKRIAVSGVLKGLKSGEGMELTADLSGQKEEACGYFLRLWRVRDGKVIRLANEGAGERFYIGSITVRV